MPEEFTFRLKRGTVIGGIVRDQAGQPIKGVKVRSRSSAGASRTVAPAPTCGWPRERDAPTTDAEGRWTLDNVPAGDDVKVQLKLSHPDYISDPNWGTLQEEQGVAMQALRARTATITMQGGLSATGTVTDPEGKPVAGAVVVRGEHPYWEWGSQEVRTDARRRLPIAAAPARAADDHRRRPGLDAGAEEGRPPARSEAGRFPPRAGQGAANPLRRPARDSRSRASTSRSTNGAATRRSTTTGIPTSSTPRSPTRPSEAGLYQWTWAPDDAVTYRFWKEGYATREAALVADGTEQTITLQAILRITGKVTDAATGRPIDKVTAIPVLESSPGRLFVERQHRRYFPGGDLHDRGRPRPTSPTACGSRPRATARP